ncbi:MAG: hypothetical protein K0V04_17275 [Deltaproteobacteria bacterium]|nr:hypothetical protein [Deltaproteobacteria bacterium]
MRWILLSVALGGCGLSLPPTAPPTAAAGPATSPSDPPPPALSVYQADPDRPRAVCDSEAAPVSQWGEGLVNAALSLR